MKQSRPNHLLIVMADQLTALALGCYGHREVRSPHLDRLAAEGVLFESAYSSSPLCTPARYAFMTGQHISRCGGYDNAAYLPATMPTFVRPKDVRPYQDADYFAHSTVPTQLSRRELKDFVALIGEDDDGNIRPEIAACL